VISYPSALLWLVVVVRRVVSVLRVIVVLHRRVGQMVQGVDRLWGEMCQFQHGLVIQLLRLGVHEVDLEEVVGRVDIWRDPCHAHWDHVSLDSDQSSAPSTNPGSDDESSVALNSWSGHLHVLPVVQFACDTNRCLHGLVSAVDWARNLKRMKSSTLKESPAGLEVVVQMAYKHHRLVGVASYRERRRHRPRRLPSSLEFVPPS